MHSRSEPRVFSIVPRPALAVFAATTLALALGAARSDAAAIAATTGVDRFEGSDGQWTRAIVGVAALPIGRGDVLAGVMGFETQAGKGGAWIVGGGLPLAGAAQLRAVATFVGGPDDRRARRIQAGPRIVAAGGRSLALSYTRDEEPGAARIDGALAEGSIPLVPKLAVRAALGYAVAESGDRGARGAMGLAWSPWRHLEVTAELGMARSAIAAAGQPLPAVARRSPTDRLFPIPGPGAEDTEADDQPPHTFTSLLGVRFPFP
jgi:hypothetical protein